MTCHDDGACRCLDAWSGMRLGTDQVAILGIDDVVAPFLCNLSNPSL